eukprot:3450864-Rhodomonas_salina.2
MVTIGLGEEGVDGGGKGGEGWFVHGYVCILCLNLPMSQRGGRINETVYFLSFFVCFLSAFQKRTLKGRGKGWLGWRDEGCRGGLVLFCRLMSGVRSRCGKNKDSACNTRK